MSDTFKNLIEQAITEAAKHLTDSLNPDQGRSTAPPKGESAELIVWRRKLMELEGSLSRFPHVMDALGEPATDAQIKRANNKLAPFRLPRWLEELYRWRNGCDPNVSSIFGDRFRSLEESLNGMLNPFDYEFGFVRDFTFAFLGADDVWTLAVLDLDGAAVDHAILTWDYMGGGPSRKYENPTAWIDDLLIDLESVDENSFTDSGWFNGYDTRKPDARWPEPVSYVYDGVRADRWPEPYRQRAGLTNYVVPQSDLPEPEDRWLVSGEPIPHAGPWDIHFGGFGREMFRSSGRRLPAMLRLPTSHYGEGAPPNPTSNILECLMPAGVLSDYTLRYGCDLDAVVWFRTETLDSDLPVIDRIRFPIDG